MLRRALGRLEADATPVRAPHQAAGRGHGALVEARGEVARRAARRRDHAHARVRVPLTGLAVLGDERDPAAVRRPPGIHVLALLPDERGGLPAARGDHEQVRVEVVGDERRGLRRDREALAVGREREARYVHVAARELRGLAGLDVHHPQPVPRVHHARRPGVVLVLLLLPALVALGLAGEVCDRLPVRRPLELRDPALGIREEGRLAAVWPDEPDLALALVGARAFLGAGLILLGAGARALREERDRPSVRGPARVLVQDLRGGEAPGLPAERGHQPHVGLIVVLIFVELRDHVGDPAPVGGDLGIGHGLEREDVVAGPGLVGGPDGDREERERGHGQRERAKQHDSTSVRGVRTRLG